MDRCSSSSKIGELFQKTLSRQSNSGNPENRLSLSDSTSIELLSCASSVLSMASAEDVDQLLNDETFGQKSEPIVELERTLLPDWQEVRLFSAEVGHTSDHGSNANRGGQSGAQCCSQDHRLVALEVAKAKRELLHLHAELARLDAERERKNRALYSAHCAAAEWQKVADAAQATAFSLHSELFNVRRQIRNAEIDAERNLQMKKIHCEWAQMRLDALRGRCAEAEQRLQKLGANIEESARE